MLAFGAVALCVLCTVLTLVWHRQAQSNRADAATSRAAAVGAASASVELRGQLDQLTAQLTELQTQKDAQKVDFLRSIDDRDRLRDQLTQTELHLADLRSKVDGTYASVLQQGNTMALLDDCLRGVGRVLNLAAVDANDAAAAELFAHYGSCVEANKAIEGSG